MSGKQEINATPRRLELSVNPDDGSLLTAPLSTVLLAATDGLYTDLYNAAHGELDVTTAQQGAADDGDNADNDEEAVPSVTQKKERMSNLSFAQRRHELAWRLAQHGKSITHIAALTAAAASTDISNATRVSTRALQHARTAWVQADEAQDALYFFHAQLFPARQPPHDVYGALDLQILGSWLDMPSDVRCVVDRYQSSRESEWASTEVAERWHLSVQDKLLRGEVGWMRRHSIHPLWKVSLKGGIVRLTHGVPKKQATAAGENNPASIYPIEALLTVMSTDTPSEWRLLSVEVRAQAKTGENNHQLEASNRQRYDLHRLCALAMAKEEDRARREADAAAGDAPDVKGQNGQKQQHQQGSVVSRPLHRLFQATHTFALSWQLEILSSQAQALRRGNWSSGETKPIVITPVKFFENSDDDVLGEVSISFWKVDTQYGPPCMGDLHLQTGSQQEQQAEHEGEQDNKGANNRSHDHSAASSSVTNQLTLSIRAQANVGVKVSMSGAQSVMDAVSTRPHIRSIIEDLLDATSNPFALSASDALLAATRLCSELKCQAVVNALQPVGGPRLLPTWMHLTVERTSIAVAARVTYHGIDSRTDPSAMVVLFRLTCDARTGSFVSIFSRSTWLLRMVACNDLKASESTALQILSLPPHRRRVAGANAIGRVVRDAFEGLSRSLNALGQRVGVGGTWQDIDSMSASLRHRAVQSACADTKVSLLKCCGMAAVYGLSALSLGIATGVAVTPDMAGDILEEIDGIPLLPTPPISVLLDQQQVETPTTTNDGERKMSSHIEQNLFALGCAATDDALTIYSAEVIVHLATPTSIPKRISCSLIEFEPQSQEESDECGVNNEDDECERPEKRRKLNGGTSNSTQQSPVIQDLTYEVERFSTILSNALE